MRPGTELGASETIGVVDDQVDLARHQILHDLRTAAVGNQPQRCAGQPLEEHARRCAARLPVPAHAQGGVVSGLAFSQVDQVGEVCRPASSLRPTISAGLLTSSAIGAKSLRTS